MKGDQLEFGALVDAPRLARERLDDGAWVLRGFALTTGDALLDAIERVAERAPFRHMVTPGGFTMSAAMTNCGALGWVSDASGYRYTAVDPASGLTWPAMPPLFRAFAHHAAAEAGFAGFDPDACLVNRYGTDARMTLHQDRNERDFSAPIVSVSLGVGAVFLFGGASRKDPVTKVTLAHGDVVVWGGPARLRYHGIRSIERESHPRTRAFRFNLTFRRAG